MDKQRKSAVLILTALSHLVPANLYHAKPIFPVGDGIYDTGLFSTFRLGQFGSGSRKIPVVEVNRIKIGKKSK
jgi:hypothetical protein